MFIPDKQANQDTGSQTQWQASYIDKGKSFMPCDIPESYFEKIVEYKDDF